MRQIPDSGSILLVDGRTILSCSAAYHTREIFGRERQISFYSFEYLAASFPKKVVIKRNTSLTEQIYRNFVSRNHIYWLLLLLTNKVGSISEKFTHDFGFRSWSRLILTHPVILFSPIGVKLDSTDWIRSNTAHFFCTRPLISYRTNRTSNLVIRNVASNVTYFAWKANICIKILGLDRFSSDNFSMQFNVIGRLSGVLGWLPFLH